MYHMYISMYMYMYIYLYYINILYVYLYICIYEHICVLLKYKNKCLYKKNISIYKECKVNLNVI